MFILGGNNSVAGMVSARVVGPLHRELWPRALNTMNYS